MKSVKPQVLYVTAIVVIISLLLWVCPRPRKSVTVSHSFPEEIECPDEIREAVAVFVTRAAEKMRRDRLAAGAVTVFTEISRFEPEGSVAKNNSGRKKVIVSLS